MIHIRIFNDQGSSGYVDKFDSYRCVYFRRNTLKFVRLNNNNNNIKMRKPKTLLRMTLLLMDNEK